MSNIIGIDIGYGYVKATLDAQRVTFPSLIGPAVEIKYHTDLITNGHGFEIGADGHRWFVGDLARLQAPYTISPRTRERSAEILRTLLYAALAELRIAAGAELRIVAGTPVAWYADRADLERTLRGAHTFTANGAEMNVSVADVAVIPQPFGAFFRLVLNDHGVLPQESLALTQTTVGVIDVGTHTTDYALADKLRYVEPQSGSIPVAMARVYELVQRACAEQHNREISLSEAEDVVRERVLRLYGKPFDVGEIVDVALDQVAQAIVGHATTLWPQAAALDTVVVTGGGALVLMPYVQRAFPQVRLAPNPQTANAEGFHRYGLRKFAS